jgi:YHS domain-containing protein
MSWAGWFWLATSLTVSTAAAVWRWPDSAHAIASLRQGGGTARHPVVLAAGPERYMVVVTAPVSPPWHGDARLAIEGEPPLEFEAQLSRPVVNLGLRHLPTMEGRVVRGLEPGDRIALWVNLAAPELDPVCGMRCTEAIRDAGHCFCSTECHATYLRNPDRYTRGGYRGQPLRLTMRDDRTGQLVMTVPISLGGGKGSHGAHH